jgi:Ca2+-binding EF-hand superfamily protein
MACSSQVASGEVCIAQSGSKVDLKHSVSHQSPGAKPAKSAKGVRRISSTSAGKAVVTSKFHHQDPSDPSGRFSFEFDRIDKNKDGWLSPSELHQGLLSCGWDQDRVCGLFDLIDTDKDGKVSKAEFISYREKTESQANSKGKKAGPTSTLKDPKGYLAFEFDRIDKNKDGWLSPSELHQGLLSAGWMQDDVSMLFELIDTNKDGRVTKAEFIAFRASPWGGQ